MFVYFNHRSYRLFNLLTEESEWISPDIMPRPVLVVSYEAQGQEADFTRAQELHGVHMQVQD